MWWKGNTEYLGRGVKAGKGSAETNVLSAAATMEFVAIEHLPSIHTGYFFFMMVGSHLRQVAT